MDIFVQWATSVAGDWTKVSITRIEDVLNLPKKPRPTSDSLIDEHPGWLAGLNCQGIDFSGYDHLAIRVLPGDGLRITGWQDDDEDFGDTRWAVQWDLMPLAPDPRIGGRLNTVQSRTVWATRDASEWFGGYQNGVYSWKKFIEPPTEVTFHGVWLPDKLWVDHQANQKKNFADWRRWGA
jgi:hypothetical protein